MRPQRRDRIAEILIKNGVIAESQLRAAMAHIDRWGGRIAHVLAETGLANEDWIVDTLSRVLRIERIRLGNMTHVTPVQRIDPEFAAERAIFPAHFKDDGKLLVVAMADPLDVDTIDEIQRRVRVRVVPCIAPEREIQAAIARHYRGHEPAPSEKVNTAMPAASTAPEAAGSTRAAGPSRAPAAGQSPAVLLNEYLGNARSPITLTEQDLRRLHAVQLNQQKSALILRAVMALLVEKGYLTTQDLGG